MVRPRKTSGPPNVPRACTGVAGLDEILGGGFPANHLYLLDGEPGTGKTTLGLQFLLDGARNGERGLYVTLSESSRELRAVATRSSSRSCSDSRLRIATAGHGPGPLHQPRSRAENAR